MEEGEQCLENAIEEIEGIREVFKNGLKDNKAAKNNIQVLENVIYDLKQSIKARDTMLKSARKSAKDARKKQCGSRGGRGRNSLTKKQILLTQLGVDNNDSLDKFFEKKTSIFKDGWAVFSRDPESVCMHILHHLGYVGENSKEVDGDYSDLRDMYERGIVKLVNVLRQNFHQNCKDRVVRLIEGRYS